MPPKGSNTLTSGEKLVFLAWIFSSALQKQSTEKVLLSGMLENCLNGLNAKKEPTMGKPWEEVLGREKLRETPQGRNNLACTMK
jgi:hypothetical protein